MTAAEHADLSRRLALAIGHSSSDMQMHAGFLWVRDQGYLFARSAWSDDPPQLPWRRFDYRDPLVIWPIAERYIRGDRHPPARDGYLRHSHDGPPADALFVDLLDGLQAPPVRKHEARIVE